MSESKGRVERLTQSVFYEWGFLNVDCTDLSTMTLNTGDTYYYISRVKSHDPTVELQTVNKFIIGLIMWFSSDNDIECNRVSYIASNMW